MKTVDVIMLAYTPDEEVHAMTRQAIESLRASEPDIEFHVLLLESNPKWPEMGLGYDPQTRVHLPDRPFNFNAFNNIGREMTGGEWLVFANNDLVFHPGWCSAMLAVYARHPELRCLCPWNPEGRRTFPEGSEFVPGYLVRVRFTGWCFMVRRDVFEKTGPFDERFDYYFADDDFAMQLRRHNILNAVVPAARVTHLAHVTSRKARIDVDAKLKADRAVFRAKWGPQRPIAWKNRLVKYVLRPLGWNRIIRRLYRAK